MGKRPLRCENTKKLDVQFTDSVKKKDIKLSEEKFGVGMRMRKDDYADLKFL